jgi:hypothetical protein
VSRLLRLPTPDGEFVFINTAVVALASVDAQVEPTVCVYLTSGNWQFVKGTMDEIMILVHGTREGW